MATLLRRWHRAFWTRGTAICTLAVITVLSGSHGLAFAQSQTAAPTAPLVPVITKSEPARPGVLSASPVRPEPVVKDSAPPVQYTTVRAIVPSGLPAAGDGSAAVGLTGSLSALLVSPALMLAVGLTVTLFASAFAHRWIRGKA